MCVELVERCRRISSTWACVRTHPVRSRASNQNAPHSVCACMCVHVRFTCKLSTAQIYNYTYRSVPRLYCGPGCHIITGSTQRGVRFAIDRKRARVDGRRHGRRLVSELAVIIAALHRCAPHLGCCARCAHYRHPFGELINPFGGADDQRPGRFRERECVCT